MGKANNKSQIGDDLSLWIWNSPENAKIVLGPYHWKEFDEQSRGMARDEICMVDPITNNPEQTQTRCIYQYKPTAIESTSRVVVYT
jgi:hypothetical protein